MIVGSAEDHWMRGALQLQRAGDAELIHEREPRGVRRAAAQSGRSFRWHLHQV